VPATQLSPQAQSDFPAAHFLAQKPPTQAAPPAQSFCVAQVKVNGTQEAVGLPKERNN